MPHRNIRAHYEQLPEFERGCILGLNETGWTNWRTLVILVEAMRPLEDAGKNGLQSCLARSGWNHTDWERIVFSDEYRFQMCPDDHRKRARRRPGQRADPAFTIAHHTGPLPEAMVWGAISFDSRTPLVVIRGPLTAKLFRYLSFCSTLALFFSKIMPDYMQRVLL
ncbi:transposable element Tc1 transposase [Trichonephila clavipes]|nr:transposable element Tc1 transposase [Trichonephila clavipes]